MSIHFSCDACGKAFNLNDDLASRKAKCKCGAIITVPEAVTADDPLDLYSIAEPPPPADAPVPEYAMPQNGSSAEEEAPPRMQLRLNIPPVMIRRFGYALFLIALLPLMWDVLAAPRFDLRDALKHAIDQHPEILTHAASAKYNSEGVLRTIMEQLPNHRFDGAFLPYDTQQHWLYAMISSVVFLLLITLPFPGTTISYPKLVGVGAFTATAGIALLLGFQFIAFHTAGWYMTGANIVTILFWIIKLIGLSYRVAMDPHSSVILSALGFTFGVGLCEEICKALPILIHYESRAEWSWRTACVVGLVSGVGFGISEGITYSHDYYNGIMGWEIYLVRFVSCVALHALWTGATAIFICRQQANLQSGEGLLSKLMWWAILVSPSMVLHGFYDTLLKKQFDAWALAIAVVSLAWFVMQMEWAEKADVDDADYQRQRHLAGFRPAKV